MRLPNTCEIEVGVDEVGRGCLLGDVVAAAVVLPSSFPDDTWKQIRDSKKLSAKKRDELARYIKEHAVAYSIGSATVEEIDTVNILQATMLAMHRACDVIVGKNIRIDKILVDGNYFKKYKDVPHEMVKGGDDKVLCIAAASILAKSYRDHMIHQLLEEHPELDRYGLATNMGYGTEKHRNAIKEYGETEYHRKSFRKN